MSNTIRPHASSGRPRQALAFASRVNTAHWDDVGRDWVLRRPDRLWRKHTDQIQISLLDRWIDVPALGSDSRQATALKTDLFDEIAGEGIVGHLLEHGCRTTGIDISPTITRAAADRNPGLVAHTADIRELPSEDGSFDLVFSGSTLDHFTSPVDITLAIGEIARVMRPSARLVLTMDNPLHPLVWLRNGPLLGMLRRSGVVPYDVGVTLGPDPLAEVVRGSGLRVLEVTAILHCPRVLAVWLARIVERRGVAAGERFLRMLSRFERLERFRFRFRTGSFVALLAVKPDFGAPDRPASSR